MRNKKVFSLLLCMVCFALCTTEAMLSRWIAVLGPFKGSNSNITRSLVNNSGLSTAKIYFAYRGVDAFNLQRGIRAEKTDEKGNTELMFAVKAGRFDDAKKLIMLHRANLDRVGPCGFTPRLRLLLHVDAGRLDPNSDLARSALQTD